MVNHIINIRNSVKYTIEKWLNMRNIRRYTVYKYKVAGLITRRSSVQIWPPQPTKSHGSLCFHGFFLYVRACSVLFIAAVERGKAAEAAGKGRLGKRPPGVQHLAGLLLRLVL